LDDSKFESQLDMLRRGDMSCCSPFGWFPRHFKGYGGDEFTEENAHKMRDSLLKLKMFCDEYERRLDALDVE
jgi:hypothetical protein